ncbi:MAG: GNAT family N-acetyltransferase [Acidimicrobiales bacterium]|jgi:GNAT superfamily N-acetyltransferase
MTFSIRAATSDDAEAIHGFIYELAVYEKEPDAVEATPASIREQMESERPPFECVIGQVDGVAVGMALFFQSYSTWKGVPGIYLEDLYVQPDHRGGGYGGALLAELASIAVERGFARVDWQVLDWNTPSIEFYENVDAEIKRDWLPCRLAGDALTAMAARSQRA